MKNCCFARLGIGRCPGTSCRCSRLVSRPRSACRLRGRCHSRPGLGGLLRRCQLRLRLGHRKRPARLHQRYLHRHDQCAVWRSIAIRLARRRAVRLQLGKACWDTALSFLALRPMSKLPQFMAKARMQLATSSTRGLRRWEPCAAASATHWIARFFTSRAVWPGARCSTKQIWRCHYRCRLLHKSNCDWLCSGRRRRI